MPETSGTNLKFKHRRQSDRRRTAPSRKNPLQRYINVKVEGTRIFIRYIFRGRTGAVHSAGFRRERGFNDEFKTHGLLGNEFEIKGLEAKGGAVQFETAKVVSAAGEAQ